MKPCPGATYLAMWWVPLLCLEIFFRDSLSCFFPLQYRRKMFCLENLGIEKWLMLGEISHTGSSECQSRRTEEIFTLIPSFWGWANCGWRLEAKTKFITELLNILYRRWIMSEAKPKFVFKTMHGKSCVASTYQRFCYYSQMYILNLSEMINYVQFHKLNLPRNIFSPWASHWKHWSSEIVGLKPWFYP